MNAVSLFQRMPWLRPLVLMVGVAASVAAGVAIVLWSRTPDYRVLYSNLEERDAASVADELDRLRVKYHVDPVTGALQVPAGRLREVRMQLAGKGLPHGAGAEFDAMTQNSGLGVSQFMETARYQHVLEAELGRTIASLQPVQAARVHLAVPKQSAFVRDGNNSSASVVLHLYTGRSLSTNQVAAVENLVASSVPDLKAADVTVVDSSGQLLSDPGRRNGTGADARSRFNYARRLEDALTAKIENLLAPMLGAGHVHASVVADMDYSEHEQTSESYNPKGKVIRSEQTSEEKKLLGDDTGGVPGALSNTPPQAAQSVPLNNAATAGAAGSSVTDTGKPVTTSSHVTRNFEVGRIISHKHEPAGRLRSLSVAVLVDNLHSVGSDGKASEHPMSQAELDRVTSLVKDAVGFDAKRGDTVDVMNTTFQEPPSAAAIPPPAWWTQPLAWSIAKNVLGVLAAVVILFVFVRPMIRGVLQAPVGPAVGPGGLLEPAPDHYSLSGETDGRARGNYDEQVGQARALVAQDPKRVAQVVKGWVGTDG